MASKPGVDAYHKLSAANLEAAQSIARDNFLNLGSWREDDIQGFIDTVAPKVDFYKNKMATDTFAYYKLMAQSAGKDFKMPRFNKADFAMDSLRNGVGAQDVYQRPFKEMWYRLSKGDDFSQALESGAQRARNIARTEVQLSRRKAGLVARNANDNIVGYIRTLSGQENCGICYLASTQRYTRGDLLPIHPGCDCGEMPIYGDTDPGQVIDQELLDATHESVEQRFGKFDVTGREIDYRKITIRDHGELGPYLTVQGTKFTKLTPTKVVTPIKPPSQVKKAVAKPFADRIQPKLKRISGKGIAADIADEHFGVDVVPLRGAKKVQPLKEKTAAHLKAIKEIGKDIDDEITNRVKKEIKDLTDPKTVAAAQKQIDQVEELLNQAKLAQESGYQSLVAKNLAKVNKEIDDRIARIRASGSSQEFIDDAIGQYTEEFRLRRATSEARAEFNRTGEALKLFREIEEYEKDLRELKASLPANMVPGSPKYQEILAAKAKEVLNEVRPTGQGGPNFVGSSKVNQLIEEAKQVYPNEWLDAAKATVGEVQTASVARGYWNKARKRLTVSFSKSNGNFKPGYSTTVHEMAHMMEDSVPGLKELEFAFAHERAALNPKRTRWSAKETGFLDNWRMTYSGKDYDYNTNSNYEIFTTGMEAVFSGGDAFTGPSFVDSIYKNPTVKPGDVDDEFRQWILGVLFSL